MTDHTQAFASYLAQIISEQAADVGIGTSDEQRAALVKLAIPFAEIAVAKRTAKGTPLETLSIQPSNESTAFMKAHETEVGRIYGF